MSKSIASKLFRISSLGLVAFAAAAAHADPIGDGAFAGYKAGWFPSHYTSCATVCRETNGARAEHEAFVVPTLSNRLTYVCKGEASQPSPQAGKGTLYGNNFQSANYAPFCIVAGLNGRVQRLERFSCLCVL